MSFRLDDLSAPDSAKISLNLNEDILSKGSHLSHFSNRNIINSNINKNSQIYNNQYPYQYQAQSPRNSQVSTPLSSKSNQIVANAPIKLIDFSRGFQINPQALNFLRSIKEEIIIVSVVGKVI